RQETGTKAPDALAYLLGIAIAAPLLVRRRWPLAVFLVSALLLVGYHAFVHAPIELRSPGRPIYGVGLAAPLAVAIYSAARAGHARAVLVVVAGLELWALGYRTLGEGESLVSALGTQTLIEILLVATLLLLAEAVRTRQAWMSEVDERLRRTEAEREREAKRGVELERLRIARELHDVLAHTIAVIGVQAGVAAEALADAPDQARAALRTIRGKSREATAEIRAALGVLREPEADAPRAPGPGLAQLDDLVDVAAGANTQVELSVTGSPRPLPAAVDPTVYRIVQESRTNVIRHAGAREATVSIENEPDAVVVEIEEDVPGSRNGAASAADGDGLDGMRGRLRRIPPIAIDAGVAVAVGIGITIAIAARQEANSEDPDALAYLLGIAIATPLLVRRRWPRAVFLVSTSFLIAYHVFDYPAIGMAAPLAVAIYSAARAGHLRAVVVVVGGLELWALGWRALAEGESLVSALGTQTLVEILLVATLLLLAETARARQAWMAEVAERLRRTEAEREREAKRRVELERLRIARELHDVLAHTIAVIGVQAGVAAEALADMPAEARSALRTMREKSREATAEIRAALGVLREPEAGAPRTPAAGLAQLEELIGAAAAAQLQVELSVTGTARPLPAVVDLTAYRIVQESLTNVIRHADTNEAQVSIRYEPEAIVVEVADDGRGSTNGTVGVTDGHGLAGMRERAAALGGRLEAGPASTGSGFRVRAWLPTGGERR
ncbi:MAG: histidine kinase, partial [Actinomycetota bacterium]|nr:histidine kinase [Actinomycetota bacterium]